MNGKDFKSAIGIAGKVNRERVEVFASGERFTIYTHGVAGEVTISITENRTFPISPIDVDPRKLAKIPVPTKAGESFELDQVGTDLVFRMGSRRIAIRRIDGGGILDRLPAGELLEDARSVSADLLRDALAHVLPAASKDEIRTLHGVFFDPNGTMVGTDGCRLHGAPFPPLRSETGAFLRRDGAEILLYALKTLGNPSVTLGVERERILEATLKSGEISVKMRLHMLDGAQFPKWQQVIPRETELIRGMCEIKALSEAVKLADKMTDTEGVSLTTDGTDLHVTTSDGFAETVDFEPVGKGTRCVGFEPRYILEALAQLDGPRVQIGIPAEDRLPMDLRSGDRWALVMPKRLK